MRYLFMVLLAALITNARAQEKSPLYMPIEFQQAYRKGTRKLDGSVSPAYWQNHSKYTIKAKVDPVRRLLRGEAVIIYQNNSPDSIFRPTFHTYHDYYRAGSKRAGFFGSDTQSVITDGVVIEKLVVENEIIDLNDPKKARHNGTNYTVNLAKGIPPKGSLRMEVTWHYTIPGKGFERSGAIDSTSMFIAYWYPEMAVMDDINGWDRIVYDAATEFYHDYSEYDIEVEAPDNFLVWASVAPLNEAEVYSQAILDRLAKAKKSKDPVRIVDESDFKKSGTGTRRWKYKATDFPDFSFALSDHFLWDACGYNDKIGEFFLHTAYPANHPEFSSVLKTIQESLRIFHNEFPVYPFPYKYFTIFNGLEGGGMEFPGMANDQEMSGAQMEEWTGVKMDDYTANLGLTLHEMCHMYFPFLMGVNEKKYAWMDEGLANFSEFFLTNQFPQPTYDQHYLASQAVLPIMAPSHIYENAGINSYTISSYSYHALYTLLGKETFLKCLKSYMDTWKHKHPTPYDFMFIFNRVSGQDLNWFWKKWYFDWGYMDVGIKNVKNNIVTIENHGGRPLAFSVVVTYEDKTTQKNLISPSVWKSATTYDHKMSGTKKISSVQLEILSYGDASAANNQWEPGAK